MSKDQAEEDIEVGEAPTDINPYFILSIDEDATQDEIKRAYRKAALKHHPDKAAPEDKDAAHTKFQEIAFAFAILSDERRRKRYDTTGRTEESLDLDDDSFDWTTYYREQFADVVSGEAINNFAEKYKGGDEERRDLLANYTKYKGSMVKIYQQVMLSDMLEDEDRFRAIIDQAIKDGEVDAFPKYTDESENSRRKRIQAERKRRDEEAGEAEELKKEVEAKSEKKKGKKAKGAGDMSDLAAMIQQRQRGREEDFFANLEAKYAPKGKGKGKQAAMEEPPEEAFRKNSKRSAAVDEVDAGNTKRTKRARK